MTGNLHIKLTVGFAWWTRIYIRMAKLADRIGIKVDHDRIANTVMRGVRIYSDGRRLK